MVTKKDGTLRLCMDYRRLNSITRKDVYPLPRVDDILDSIGRDGPIQHFSKLDLQVRMSATDQEKTAFTTFFGLFEFTTMPFSL